MSRAYRNVRPKANLVYSVADVQTLCRICRNTVSNWISSGLRPCDNRGPQLFRGEELIRFLNEGHRPQRSPLKKGQFKCLACKARVFPEVETQQLFGIETGNPSARARCPDCNAVMKKFLDETECDSLQNCINTNTSLARADEVAGAEPAGIGKKGYKVVKDWHSANDRIIYQWQLYARRYDAKTIDAHLASIRDFEKFLMGKPFEKVTTHDADAFRTALIAKGQKSESDGRLSKSTIRHRVSHLTAFFGWLRGQIGYKRLPSGIQDYFALPRGATALAFSPDPKPFPTIDEAIGAVKAMLARTLLQRRNRAIVALAFVCGFRAAALISLRLRHLDLEHKRVVHDGTEMECPH